MPIYAYQCSACEKSVAVEHEQKITDPPLKLKCVFCLGPMMRIVQATSFILKGSRWAKDGYK
jgi:putative FmdB family regulatory protein